MGELPATAICGNDITSSCLYVSALAILQAGKWAPLVLLFVAGVLYLFRKIYSEVVGALPLNGGAYNALLNTTSKFLASLAACLTLLSYMATAVISANEAAHYAHSIWQALPLLAGTIVLLGFFTRPWPWFPSSRWPNTRRRFWPTWALWRVGSGCPSSFPWMPPWSSAVPS